VAGTIFLISLVYLSSWLGPITGSRLVKTKLRSCITQDRLESVMLVFVEQELASELDPEDIIEEFKHLNNTQRRLSGKFG